MYALLKLFMAGKQMIHGNESIINQLFSFSMTNLAVAFCHLVPFWAHIRFPVVADPW
jgi:hypothetical protein